MSVMSDAGLAFLIQREAIKRWMYKDTAGLPTIGIGHLLTKDELSSGKIDIQGERIEWHDEDGLTEVEVKKLFHQDLKKYENAVSKTVIVGLLPNQFDCLVSFCFNTGTEAFSGSTLVKKLNAGDFASIPGELRKWKYSAGKVDKGLINRREKEVELWNG